MPPSNPVQSSASRPRRTPLPSLCLTPQHLQLQVGSVSLVTALLAPPPSIPLKTRHPTTLPLRSTNRIGSTSTMNDQSVHLLHSRSLQLMISLQSLTLTRPLVHLPPRVSPLYLSMTIMDCISCFRPPGRAPQSPPRSPPWNTALLTCPFPRPMGNRMPV